MSDEISLDDFLGDAANQNNPINALKTFLEKESSYEKAKQVDKMRFVGYVLELGYETAKIITSDPYKLAVGGIPRGSFLIMTPNNIGKITPHFTLLRVNGVSPTPLSSQVQQTYFELHKKSMPELDVWTQSELQWGALDCDVLGMFYASPTNVDRLAYSGDVNNVVSAHRYKVYAPDEALLELIVNGTVKPEHQFDLGVLRTMECQLPFSSENKQLDTPVKISMQDFKGCRTAMFGKTRLGKSNVVKLIAQGMLEATKTDNSVGQIIFDINGEYANDNPQNKSIRGAYESRCQVYALTPRVSTPSKPLRLNFYEQPESGLGVLAAMLEQDSKTSNYIRSFGSVILPSIDSISVLPDDERDRPVRKIQMYWAVLHKAGFPASLDRLRKKGLYAYNAKNFDPGFSESLRKAAYKAVEETDQPPASPIDLHGMVREFEVMAKFRRDNPKNKALVTSSGNPTFEPSDIAILDFLAPSFGGSSGPSLLSNYIKYHAPNADDFLNEIIALVSKGITVILDLGSATDSIRRYFADIISRQVFVSQEEKFVNNSLGDHFVQLYFEEAHNLFPPNDNDLTGVYARFAKEGAKFHIGMVYSTQSPSTINRELLAQTENFFVGHISSQDEVRALSRVQVAFAGTEQDIMRAKTPGYMRMLTMSNRFVIPVQAKLFEVDSSNK